LKSHTHVITTSYISPAIHTFDAATRAANITVLNEVGVDPGIDHMYAIKTIHDVHAHGGKIREFHSYCGGLPASEHANNPLGFKFSWSPRGALLSQRNGARFLANGIIEEIAAEDLMDIAKSYHVMRGYEFVAYPNRDSVPFRDLYGIPEAHTVVRGSLRYKGNPAFVAALGRLGWLDEEEKEWLGEGMTWKQIMGKMLGVEG
jgi:saccharopine dehydrogenase (NADP+, L-glutamate forming)